MQLKPAANADPEKPNQKGKGSFGIIVLVSDIDVTKGLAIILSILENYKEPQDHSYEFYLIQKTGLHMQSF